MAKTVEGVPAVAGTEPADRGQVAFLGVERSLSGRLWWWEETDDRKVAALSRQFGVPDLVARVLVARGIGPDEAEGFLSPSLRQQLPDPSRLKDMDRAADCLAEAIVSGRRIGIFGDYDVDGATSTAMLVRYLRAVGARPSFHIPDRVTEGYGPNLTALETMYREGIRCVVLADCGTTAFETIAGARALGLEIIVIDHHAAEARLPEAVAVVNPNRLDDQSGTGCLAACGVTFMVLVALNRRLRAAGRFRDGSVEPDLLQLLDLVALGTICDVVPLQGLNRAFAAQGLKVMTSGINRGLAALARVSGVSGTMEAYHAGFILGPRINAGGRVGKSWLGAQLLASDDPNEVEEIARLLDANNDDRKVVEQSVLQAALAQIDEAEAKRPVIVAQGEGWHPGVIGIVAGRLKERFGRPACVIAWETSGPADQAEGGQPAPSAEGVCLGKASGRSVPGVDLGGAVIEARRAGLLEAGGGHGMAAGFTIRQDKLAAFKAFMEEIVRRQIAALLPEGGKTDESPLARRYRVDGLLAVEAATVEVARLVARLGPFGQGNAEPRFVVPSVRIVTPRLVGSGHVSFIASGSGGARLRAIAFRAADGPLGEALLGAGRDVPAHIAGTLRVDTWRGEERVQMFVDDAAFAWG